jgi:hypothetical protein
LVGGTCLTKALAARALAPASFAPLTVAVRTDVDARCVPEFHAWTDVSGTIVPPTSVEQYTPLAVWV